MKILQIGAHEELMMNYYRHFKTGNVRFDYILQNGNADFRFKSDPKFDGKLWYVTALKTSHIKWIIDVIRILRKENYQIVHLHLGYFNIYGLIACLFAPSVKVKICHSHSFYESHSNISKIYRLTSKYFINKLSTNRLACSFDAGTQMFYKQFDIMKNVIDYNRLKYNEEKRIAIRKSLGYEDRFIIGHVGNLSPEKNHLFIIEVFELLLQKVPEAKLMLIGKDYGTMVACRKKAKDHGILDKIAFMGERSDVPDLVQSMDCFVFPSLFEGLPLALLEAQVSGLKCFYSSSIPIDGIISKSAIRLDLEKGSLQWANSVHQYYLSPHKRNDHTNLIKSDFDAASHAQWLENYYLKLGD